MSNPDDHRHGESEENLEVSEIFQPSSWLWDFESQGAGIETRAAR